MPGSAISASNSSTSSASKRAKTRQYRVISNTSQIDESLFGQPNRVAKRNEMLKDMWTGERTQDVSLETLAKQRSDKRRKGKSSNRETVQVITKDLIRNLIVPTEDPSGQTMILSRRDFERILQGARTFSKSEKEARSDSIKMAKEAAMDAAQERKNYMKAMDLARQKNERLNDLEEEAKDKAEHLLSKANEMRQEQEDEIKHLNELILNAKCHAIRDAQILEKGHVKREMTEEEKRLDIMMEVDRQNAIRIQEEIERKKKDDQLIGAAKLMEQIQENEQERLFELERKDQENIQMQKYIGKLMEEDQDMKDKRKAEQTDLREELNKANDDIIRRRDVKKLQEQAEEMKVLEYQRQKAEREAAFEKEQERIRIEKEREVARLRALQERARDEQAERDALRAKRAQEQAEREWRKKEAAEAYKKSEMEAMLKGARSMQMSQKEHYLAVQAQRERSEFERVLRAQKELVEKEQREDDVMRKKRLTHAEEVRRQIRQKEHEKVKERNNFFEEGVKLDEEARVRRNRLEEVKRKKLQELREAGIPEKYLSQVERKVNQPAKIMA
ncbi:cilia- and flagella-associated protein 45-like isoform X2 [Haliotis rufescens]|uniref:cilia- and flagella-associated protein 45-like isoform X2 n=1 Tax=Haliotis rufescens TaxID=6454 RepID=UPI001EAFD6E8|nr:cilia- and flagella-associated protein 45-like isoform X2 [Haliotis rufescens]